MNIKLKEQLEKTAGSTAYMNNLHIEVLELEEGYCKGRMKVEADILNHYGTVEGGALFSLGDIIGGFAACTYGHYVTTIQGNMNYLKPAMNTEYIYCEGRVIRQGRQVAVYDVKMTDTAGELLETGTFTFHVMQQEIV